ncbi:lytic transglycosylase domain-containing protein [Streptomyces griseoflavus]|uniref:lytic transglycosylase domain-containing protein n=1 Tax=Streptomyces griseoflavus TaxID=35619 RepID=UPI003D7182DA
MGAGSDRSAEGGASAATRNTFIAGTGCGCLLSPVVLAGGAIVVIIICGFGVLLAPLIALILLFGGGGGGGGDGASNEEIAQQVMDAFEGDGKGELEESTVPEDLVDPIKDAGAVCEAIGPIVIAAQIEYESGFDASLVGSGGERGLSQLPPEVFEEYGEDDDDNDEVSALDAEDSVMAQGRYLCALAEQVQQALDDGRAEGDALSLTLAAYHVGIDTVLAAGGLPRTNEAQGYVAAVRAQFAKYAGVAAPPDGATPGVTPDPAASPA